MVETDDVYNSHVERKINTTTVQCNDNHFINVLLSLTSCSVVETDDVYNSHVERKINTTTFNAMAFIL